MFCPQCSNEIVSERARFCTRCSFPLANVKEFVETQFSSARPEEDLGNQKLISPAVYWEIAIKISINKYHLTEPYETLWIGGSGKMGSLYCRSSHGIHRY
jgi:hypothetical protein